MNPSAAEFQPSQAGYAAGAGTCPSPEQGGGKEEEEEAVVSMLKLTFPSFSTRALRDLYKSQCHSSIEETVDAIFKIEAEVQGARLASAQPPAAALTRQKPPDSTVHASQLSEEEFPSLGSGQSAAVHGRNTVSSAPFGGDFASKVKSTPSPQQVHLNSSMHC
eukprot:jgi/Picre1/27705/NNA_000669.t1